MSKLLIRADAGETIGSGHVMRCLALAQAWEDAGGDAVFAVTSGAQALLPRLQSEGFEIAMLAVEPGSNEDGYATAKLARARDAAWVAVDGYCFGADFQKLIKDANLSLLFVDDDGYAGHYCADLLLNQNVNADAALYPSRAATTRLLLGPRYALLRREFLAARQQKPLAPTAGRLLVTMGGSDPANITGFVLESLDLLRGDRLEVKAVVGPANMSGPALQRKSVSYALELVSGADMPELMNWADVAVSAAGITTWELLYLGVPTALIIAAENQRGNAETLAASGAVINLGGGEQLRPASIAERIGAVLADLGLRLRLRERGAGLVDGKGTERVMECMDRKRLELRRATADDARLLWEWANDAETRAASFSSAPIPWEIHLAWFSERLADPATLLYVAVENGEPIGQLRYQLEGDCAVVSVSIARGRRGQGYGKKLLRRGTEKVFEESRARTIHAYVKPANAASQRAFLQAEFKPAQKTNVRGQEAVLWVREK